MEIVIYRNKPAGMRCVELTKNVFKALSEVLEDVEEEVTVRVLNFSEKVKEVKGAPALIVNSKVIVENPSLDEIVKEYTEEKLKEIIRQNI